MGPNSGRTVFTRCTVLNKTTSFFLNIPQLPSLNCLRLQPKLRFLLTSTFCPPNLFWTHSSQALARTTPLKWLFVKAASDLRSPSSVLSSQPHAGFDAADHSPFVKHVLHLRWEAFLSLASALSGLSSADSCPFSFNGCTASRPHPNRTPAFTSEELPISGL